MTTPRERCPTCGHPTNNAERDPAGPIKFFMLVAGTICVLLGTGVLIGIGLAAIYM